jgi:hypothetical protein
VTSRPGSGSCRAKTPLAANRSSGRSRNGAIAICDAFWWSEPAAVLRYARHKPENGHRVGDAPVGAAFFQRANEVVASKQANRATHSVHHRELALAGVQRGLDRRVDMCSSGVSDANLVDIATVTGTPRAFSAGVIGFVSFIAKSSVSTAALASSFVIGWPRGGCDMQ